MNRIIISFVLFSFSVSIQAQLLESKLNLNLGVGLSGFTGGELVHSDGFIHPSLYANFQSVYDLSLKATADLGRILDVSMVMDRCRASDWSFPEYDLYESSTAEIYILSPAIVVHTPFREEGFFNRVKLFAEFGPAGGISLFKSTEPLFEISPIDGLNGGTVEKSTDLLMGLESGAGMDVFANQNLGFFVSCNYSVSWMDSRVFTDRTIQRFGITTGVILNLISDKHLYR